MTVTAYYTNGELKIALGSRISMRSRASFVEMMDYTESHMWKRFLGYQRKSEIVG
jgi:hypothetical protein